MSSGPASIFGRRATVAFLALAFVWLAMPAVASAANGGISGKVTMAEGGTPLQDVYVCAMVRTEALFDNGCESTAADGSYEITGLKPADYVVSFQVLDRTVPLAGQYYGGVSSVEEADKVTVVSEATTPGIDAALVEGGSIAGKVTRAIDGAAVTKVEVCAKDPAGYVSDALDSKCADTGADGAYEITHLQPGAYLVEFHLDRQDLESNPFLVNQQFYDGAGREEDATEVIVTGSGVTKTGIDTALIQGGVVEGTVSDAITGEPLAGITVCARSEEGFGSNCDFAAKGDGRFRIPGLHAGLTKISFNQLITIRPYPLIRYEDETLNAVPVSAGATLNVEQSLPRKGGWVKGHVYAAANRQPLGDVAVCAIWAEKDRIERCDTTDAAGEYGFVELAVGAWKIVFSPDRDENELWWIPGRVWPTQFWSSQSTLATANTIDVTPNSVFADVDGLLGPGPPPATAPPVTAAPPPGLTESQPKPLRCGKGKVKKRVKGKARCVKRHKPRHRHKRHHHEKHGHRHR